MSKYEVNLTFNLVTAVEPDGTVEGLDDDDAVLDSRDDSSFDSDRITSSGGDVYLTVEAADEDAACAIARDAFAQVQFRSDDDVEWEIEDLDVYGVELLDEPMTSGRAFEIVEAWLAAGASAPNQEQIGALIFLLAQLQKLANAAPAEA